MSGGVRIIAMMNQKGGVGKTTSTVNLGAALAELGKNVCLMDLDPQAHLSINYGLEPTEEIVSLYDVLVHERSILEAVRKVDERIALVPSSIDLAAAEIELVTVLGREVLLKKRLESLDHEFDFILLDCPPSLGLLTLNALAAAGEVVIPMQPHFLPLQGVAKLLETVQLVNKRMNPGLKVTGILLTMFDAQTKLSNEVVAELNGFIESAKGKPLPWADAKVFNSRIRRNIKLAESPSFGQHILRYDASSNGAADYRALARELVGLEPLPPSIGKTSTKPQRSSQLNADQKGKGMPPDRTGPGVEVSVSPIDPSTLAAARAARPADAPARPATPRDTEVAT